MEVVTLAGLVGMGYIVSRLGEAKPGVPAPTPTANEKKACATPQIPPRMPRSEYAEPFQGNRMERAPEERGYGGLPGEGFRSKRNTEGFMPAARGPDSSPLTLAPKGAAAVGYGSELDLMYQVPAGGQYPSQGDYANHMNSYPYTNDRGAMGAMTQVPSVPNSPGGMYPSEPNPGPLYGYPTGYANQRPPLAPQVQQPGPSPVAMTGNRAMVEMRADNVEENPVYVDGDYVVSPLSGQKVLAKDYTHSNMMPFFRGQVKQNLESFANTQRLDAFTGAGSTQIAKREIEPMFNTGQTPFGNPYGMEDNTDFVQSRINAPRNRAGERPFEPVKVAPGVGQEYGSLGEGGFQQMEVNEIMKKAMKDTDELRVATNPKQTYKTPVVPGARYITNASEDAGEVRKYRPDRFYIDETGERLFVTNGEVIKDAVRPTQILNYTTRPETSKEYIGPAASQEFQEAYVTGSYRTPMTQQYGGAGFRNADMTTYYTNELGGETEREKSKEGFQGGEYVPNDYGRGSYENRDNERTATQDRMQGLNLAPAEAGAVTAHYDDPSRPTRRAETIGNIRQTGTPVGYAGSGVPAITVWDPTDVARTTVKEGTIDFNYYGGAAPGSAPTRLKVYDPDDIAKPTQKAQLSKRDYYGAPMSSHTNHTSHEASLNMRLNPNKQQVAALRKPTAGNGNIAVFDGNINQVTKKLDADYINDRPNAVNRVQSLTTGAGDLGRVKYRHPLQQDIYTQRTQPEFVAAVEENPLNISLRKNAETDERNMLQRYTEMFSPSQAKKDGK